MNDHIEFVSVAYERCGDSVDVGLLLHVAWIKCLCAEFLAQFFNGGLGALVLIREQKRRALADIGLRDRVGDAPFVPHSQYDYGLVLQEIGHRRAFYRKSRFRSYPRWFLDLKIFDARTRPSL